MIFLLLVFSFANLLFFIVIPYSIENKGNKKILKQYQHPMNAKNDLFYYTY